MPTYQYKCKQCDHRVEAVQSFSDPALTDCPLCGGPLRKVFSTVGVVFKGSGFYRTDSRAAAAAGKSEESAAKAERGSEARSGTKTETKSESKSETASAAKADGKSGSSSGSSSKARGKSSGKTSGRTESSTTSKSA